MSKNNKILPVFFGCLMICTNLLAQNDQVPVEGVIKDNETREPLIGAYVLQGNPPKGIAVTDIDGNFKVSVPEGTDLTFRFLGYEDQKITLKPGQTFVEVDMKEKINAMDEVVVRGYQPRTRELTTGSSYIISGEEVQDVPVSNVEQLLQGKVAGLNVQNNTGAPGMRGSVQIRGLSTLSVTGGGNGAFLQPTSPLYIIDGVPMDADKASEFGFQQQGPGVSPLSLIPQEDIESIEILKDATATSMYGSRGAYGVILINTKRGQSLVPRVRYTANFFMNDIPKLRETLGGTYERNVKLKIIKDYARERYDIQQISNTPFLSDSLNPYYNNSTNWQEIFYQRTYNQSHNLAIDGGDAKFNYKTNLGYYSETGIIKNTGFDRYNINMNMEFKPSSKLRFFGAVYGAVGRIQKGDGVGLLQTGVASGGRNSSLLPPPSFYQATSSTLSTLRTINTAGPKNLRTNIDVSYYDLLPGLSVGTTGSYDYTLETDETFTPAAANQQFAKIYAYNSRSSTFYNRNNVSYSKTFKEKHNLFLNFFNEFYISKGQASVMTLERLPNDQFHGPLGYDGLLSRGGNLGGDYRNQRSASFASAFSYNYKKKYILDVTYRLDGTSVSGSKDPYSKNPSVGLRWNFDRENLLKDLNWLNYGSLRFTAGRNIIPAGSLVDIYGRYNIRTNYNNNKSIGIDYEQLPNPLLKPTRSSMIDLGLDAGFFDSRIEIIFDTYFKKVDNLLFIENLSNTLGFDVFKSNDAAIANYGYELSLTGRPLSRTSKVNWSITLNGAINKDVLVQLPEEYGGQYIQWDNSGMGQHVVFRVGQNTLSNYLRINEGVYSTTADVPVDPVTGLRYRNEGDPSKTFFEAGDPIFMDMDGNYILDQVDYEITGNSQPTVTGGISNVITYKNFSLNVYSSFTIKRAILNNALADRLRSMADPFSAGGNSAVVPLENLNMWSPLEDDLASSSSFRYPNAYNYYHNRYIDPFRYDQTLWQEDGTYLKINSVTFAYQFDKKLVKQLGLSFLRAYISGNNLATFSMYSGPNPENVSNMGRDISGGYPIPRSYTFGVNVEF